MLIWDSVLGPEPARGADFPPVHPRPLERASRGVRLKTNDLRGAAGEADTPKEFGADSTANLPAVAWWLVAAGHRQSDTKNRDFYARLEVEC